MHLELDSVLDSHVAQIIAVRSGDIFAGDDQPFLGNTAPRQR